MTNRSNEIERIQMYSSDNSKVDNDNDNNSKSTILIKGINNYINSTHIHVFMTTRFQKQSPYFYVFAIIIINKIELLVVLLETTWFFVILTTEANFLLDISKFYQGN